MRKLLLVIMAVLFIYPLLALTTGDIAILAVNADITKTLTFVALADIPANTTISFTDNAWNATTQVWRTGEGTIAWNHTALVTKGTVVTITLAATYTVDIGSVNTVAGFNLSTSGDQVLAYEGTTAPTSNTDALWLFGFSLENWLWANNTNTSDLPTALIGASVALTSSTTEFDNGYFANGATAQTIVSVSGTKAELLALFIDNTKYYTNDTGPLTIPTYTITVGGGSTTPTINVSGTLNAFSTTTGTPSASQSYTLSGSNLTANIAVAALAGYQYSTDDTNWSNTLSLASSFSGLVYVRLTGATAGSYSGDIVHSSTGATSVNLAASGTVTAPTPTITLGGTLSPFATTTGSPSAAQSYTVAGAYLTGDINIAAVTGFEYSLSSGSGYASTLALTPVSGTVATTTIYVRLAGTTAGDYSGNIAHTSAGATQQDKAVSGSVSAPASPETFFEDNFEYTAATLLTANGWTAHSGGGTNSFTVASSGLSYAGYPANSGLAAQTTGTSGEDVNRTFTAQTSGAVYASLLANLSSAHANGDYFFHLAASPVSGDFKGRIFAQSNASNQVRFGVSRGGNNTTAIWTDYVYALDTTYLLVLKYQIVAGATNDVVSLWVNPTIGPSEPAANCISTDITAADAANIGGVALRQGNTTTPTPAAKYDGIRIANTWAQLWTVPATPVLHVNAVELDALESIVDIASEEYRTYNLYGENLTSQIVVTAPNGFKLATAIDGELSQSLNLPTDFNGTIYVRLFSSTTGDFSGNITHTSGSAEQVNVIVSGTCYPPAVVWNITQSLVPFASNVGTPSDMQSYSLSASNATADLVVTTTAPFELSSNGISGWATELILANSYNGLVYVRLNSAIPGDFNANITHTSLDASPASFAISGQATPAAGYAYDLFFSEYVEGSSSNKAIEIFNGTGATVDLSNYTIKLGSNGAAWGNTLTPTGTLAHGEVYVIANADANASILGASDVTSTVTFYNGDDALALFHGETQIDAIGVYQVDPGTAWSVAGIANATVEHTLIRKPSVIRGNLDFIAGAGTTTEDSEWIVQAQDYSTDLGMHTFGSAVTPDAPVVTITRDGANVVLTWEAVAGASSYSIESSDDPYTGFSPVETVASSPWSGLASGAKKFYRVIALP